MRLVGQSLTCDEGIIAKGVWLERAFWVGWLLRGWGFMEIIIEAMARCWVVVR